MVTSYSHPSEGRLETECYFFLLLGLRLKDLLIGLGINPLVLLCLGFLNKMPRNTINAMTIRASIIVRLLQILNKNPLSSVIYPHTFIFMSQAS